MEKTLTINISGWVFNINEDAYEMLTEYFKRLNKHFKKQQGGSEIVADIEFRVAELFKERNTEQETVIDKESVEKVIKIMGQPYQMEEDDDDDEDHKQSEPYQKKMKKKLFRDPYNAHIGGVSSGLGKYINLDPIIIRIIFILLVPTGGLGVILYLILWVLMPPASSTSDRIKMEGKRVNIENIESKVREEASYIKDRLSDFSEEALDVYNKTSPARKYSLSKIEIIVQSIGKFMLKVLKILLGLILFLTGIGFLIPFAIFYFNWVPELQFDTFFVNGMSFPSFLSAFIFDSKYTIITLFALTIVVLIPIIMLIYHGIRFIFNLKRNKTVGTIAFQSWLVALIISIGMSYSTIRSYRSDAINITSHHFEDVKSDTLNVSMRADSYYQDVLSGDHKTVMSYDYNFPILHDEEFYGEPRLEIFNTDKEHFELKLYLSANGKDEEQANNNVQNIGYNFKIDSTGLVLDPYFKLGGNKKYRNQDVVLKLYIPNGKAISVETVIRKHFRLKYNWSRRLWDNKAKVGYWAASDNKFIDPIEAVEFEEIGEEAVNEPIEEEETTEDN